MNALCIIILIKGEVIMKNTIKIVSAISAVMASSAAFGVAGLDM